MKDDPWPVGGWLLWNDYQSPSKAERQVSDPQKHQSLGKSACWHCCKYSAAQHCKWSPVVYMEDADLSATIHLQSKRCPFWNLMTCRTFTLKAKKNFYSDLHHTFSRFHYQVLVGNCLQTNWCFLCKLQAICQQPECFLSLISSNLKQLLVAKSLLNKFTIHLV